MAAPSIPIDRLLAVARGDTPADLILRNGRVINVFSGEIESTDIAIAGDRIAALGPGYQSEQVIDLNGAFVAPGMIDAHVHIESSLCLPPQFADAIVPRGITTVVADPHEIANVCGVAGVRFIADASRDLPLRVVLMAPSCVPATDLATTGAKLSADDLKQLLDEGVVHGLAEVMNFPGVIHHDDQVRRKFDAFRGRPIDGHSPAVTGRALNAYVAAGVGSDHECVTLSEAREKVSVGMYVLIREATNARNLDALLPLITLANSRRICFCTDDRTPCDLMDVGSIDGIVRRAIAAGIEPITAFRCATLNPAEWFRLHDRGAVAPGRFADLFVFEELERPVARAVYSSGRCVAREGKLIVPLPPVEVPAQVRQTLRIETVPDIAVAATGARIRVISARPDQLLTDSLEVVALRREGLVVADTSRDILKIVVIDRHSGSARAGVAFVKGFGLKRGSIGGTVAHDHHNIVAIGCTDQAICAAAQEIIRIGGGLIAIDEPDVNIASLALPIAGLMSTQPITDVSIAYRAVLAAAKRLGATMRDPFMAMSFMALEVIPSLKLTDLGLVDVEKFKQVGLFV